MRWGVFLVVMLAACSRQALDVGARRDAALDAALDARVLLDASVDASVDARASDDGGVDAAVLDGAVADAAIDASLDGSAPRACCSFDGVTTDCSEACVPTDVTFDRMWPCPTVGRCVQSVRLDGRRVHERDDVGDLARDYDCNGSVVLASDGSALGRYDADTEVLLLDQDSYCASDACRALWQVDGCASLFDGEWESPSTTGCPDDDPFEPRGCAYRLDFEAHGQTLPPLPALGPSCTVWGDDLVSSYPMSCTDNVGTCGGQPMRVHPTLGIEYGGRWHPVSIVPCDELAGTWIATDCACTDDTMDTACPPMLHVSSDDTAVIGDLTTGRMGTVYCEGNDFVLLANDRPPPDAAFVGQLAVGDIDVATDTLSVYWQRTRAWTFVRTAMRE